MSNIYMTYGGMITPIGSTAMENFSAMEKEESGVDFVENS